MEVIENENRRYNTKTVFKKITEEKKIYKGNIRTVTNQIGKKQRK